MVRKEIDEHSDPGTNTWRYNDVETGECVYWVTMVHSGITDISYVRFGKVGGDEFTKVFHSPRLAYKAFVEIQNTLDARLIQRGEMDLPEETPGDYLKDNNFKDLMQTFTVIV